MCATRNEGPFTLAATAAVAEAVLVKISAGEAVACGLGEEPIGITNAPAAAGEVVSLWPLRGDAQKVTAAKTIAAGAALYPAASGCVSDAAVGTQIGIALSAATGAGGKLSAIIWGPRGGSDVFTARGGRIEFFDDFFEFDGTATVGKWEDSVLDTTGAIGMTDANGGVLSIATHSDDNDEGYISSIAETFKFQATKRLFFEARVKLTEAATDDANIIVGLSDTVAADSLLDNGAGPMASYDGAVLFKVDGGTVWQAETSNAGTQVTDTDAGAFTSGAWTRLGIFYDYNDGVTAKVYFYVDGVLGATCNLTIAGLEEMHIVLGAKAGGGNAETLLVDYVHVIEDR